MKKPKSKVATVKMAVVKPPENTSDENPQLAKLNKLMAELQFYPTVSDLAQIAAQIVRREDFDTGNHNAAEASRMASNLWSCCYCELANDLARRISRIEFEGEPEEPEEPDETYFKPMDKYPITRDQFLQRVMPQYKNRPDKLAQKGKAFVRDSLRDRKRREPTQDEVNASYSEWKPLATFAQAGSLGILFKNWYQQCVKQARRDAGLKSAGIKSKTRRVNL